MADAFFRASWGPVRLWLASFDSAGGRSLVIHELSHGDLPVVQDRGRAPKRTSCELLFADMPGEQESPLARFRRFNALVDEGDAQIFTHPIDGSFLARVEGLRYSVNADDQQVRATCDFVPAGDVGAVSPAGAGTSPAAGRDAVVADAELARAELGELGLASAAPAAAVASATKWAEAEDVSPREVFADIGSRTQEITDEVERLKLEADLGLWPAYVAFVRLQSSLASAAEAATADVGALFAMRIDQPIALRTLVARVYGGAEAEERYRQVLQLNDIDAPGRLAPGTTLQMPAQAPQPRRS